MNANEIRSSYLEFFRSKGHDIVPSAPVVLPSDPTLLFVNAGMNPFKEIFLGARAAEHPRVANSQKCIRVSGKHNDLEDVGHDTYHHTFFEMLGNWSFGDYYKREAIGWAWELLTTVWKLPKERIYATIYKDDDEAGQIWRELTDIDPAHIQKFGDKDNFWEMGETGPCGPCSEIHIDLTEDGSGASLVNAGSPEVIEIWNLVFIQYNRRADGSLEELPSKHVDTGMGFERLCTVLQGKKSNYDTDIFQPIIRELERLSGRAYSGDDAVAMRVIADHLRTLSFAIADGVLPSNEGRGYVLRRLLRRAVRYGRNLGFDRPFMASLMTILAESMGTAYPQLHDQRATIERLILAEEKSFASTLGRGIHLFEEVVADLRARNADTVPGETAFKLYDTYGFPLDLTALMANEAGMGVDSDGFEALMLEKQQHERELRRQGGSGNDADLMADLVSAGVQSRFCGYTRLDHSSAVLAVIVDGQLVEEISEGQEASLILAETPFYGESGGQQGDTGHLTSASGASFHVGDTRKPAAGIILHQGKLGAGTIKKGELLHAEVNAERRQGLSRHHSATHLLNHGLRSVLGPMVKQAGSLVAVDRLRFDFSYHEALSSSQLEEIERIVNACVSQAAGVGTYEMSMKDVPGSGIIAVFDEKYGETVRVVDIGGYSRELCGGTHVSHVGELGSVRILTESSVASGVRRLEAVCAAPAIEVTLSERRLLKQAASLLSVTPSEVPTRIEFLLKQQKFLEKQLQKQAAEAAKGAGVALAEQIETIAGLPVLVHFTEGAGVEELRSMVDTLRERTVDCCIVLGGNGGGKAAFVAAISKAGVAQGLHAGNLVKAAAQLCGGNGGGQAEKAQAGAKDASQIPTALAQTSASIRQALLG